MALQYIDWDSGEVTVIDLSGRITHGEGTSKLRQSVEEVLERGRRNILLNFAEVFYVDSSGLGTLLEIRSMVAAVEGRVKLMKLRELTRNAMQVMRIHTLFEVFADQESAMRSFE